MFADNKGEAAISLTLCVLGSGSKGNSIFLRSDNTNILIDAGLSARQIEQRLDSIGVKLNELDALLITHEHRDHLSGARVLAKRHPLPVYLNKATWRAGKPLLGEQTAIKHFENGACFKIGDLTIEAFSISHDAADPVGYIVHSARHKAAVATDIGHVTTLVKEKLKGAHLMVLEANHDLEMLKIGPYPWVVKQRVWGRRGHLSNEDSASLLRELYHSELQHVVMAHVSETNNCKHLVQQTMDNILAECASHEVNCLIATQNEVGPQIHLA